jgi:hypothetical protein
MNYKYIFILKLTLVAQSIHASSTPQKLVLIDTAGKNRTAYHALITLATHAGYAVSYRSFIDLLEHPHIEPCNALLIVLDTLFLKHIQHPLTTRVLNALHGAVETSQPAVGIIMPYRVSNSAVYKARITGFLQRLYEPRISLKNNASIALFLDIATHSTTALTHTTLLARNDKKRSSYIDTLKRIRNQKSTLQEPTEFFDIAQHPTPNIRPCSDCTPFASMITLLPDSQSPLLITSSAQCLSAELEEDCMVTPESLHEREQLVEHTQALLAYWKDVNEAHSFIIPVKDGSCAHTEHKANDMRALKAALVKTCPKAHTVSPSWMKQGMSCAWLDPADFFATFDELGLIAAHIKETHPDLSEDERTTLGKATALDRAVRCSIDPDYTMLWLEFFPEWYLSTQGIKQQEKEVYQERVTTIMRALTAYCQHTGKALPKIFLGMNISSNFKMVKAHTPAVDIFGTVYPHIPAPLDKQYLWKPEVVDVFNAFCDMTADIMPIDGVFFDLEMYHAPHETGAYLPLMDFSDSSWHQYVAHEGNPNLAPLTTVTARVNYLIATKKLLHYFSFLEQQARAIGTYIKNSLQERIPDLVFAAYAPSLPASWFYRGLCAGLSDRAHPLFFASFNALYCPHERALAAAGIHCFHSQSAMLSKFKTHADASYIDTALAHHPSLWFNRPTRLAYEYTQQELDKVWWGIESSPLGLQQFNNMVHKKLKQHYPSTATRKFDF